MRWRLFFSKEANCNSREPDPGMNQFSVGGVGSFLFQDLNKQGTKRAGDDGAHFGFIIPGECGENYVSKQQH